MKFTKYFLVLISLVSLSCGSSSTTPQNSTRKFETLQKLLTERKFKVVFDQASPQTSNALNQVANKLNLSANGSNASFIDITGNSNYFKVKGDTVSAFLPFYGERHSGNSLDANNGIEFNGIPKDYKLTENKDKKRFRLDFSIRDKDHPSEHYKISAQFFENGKTTLQVSSSQRSAMGYNGEVERLNE